MKPSKDFVNLSKDFWANIRSISQKSGYTERNTRRIKIPATEEIKTVFTDLDLTCRHLIDDNDKLTPQGIKVIDYFKYRADILNNYVEPRLMDADKAKNITTRPPSAAGSPTAFTSLCWTAWNWRSCMNMKASKFYITSW